MIVRTMQINQPVPQLLEHIEGGWASVDELAVGACCAENSFYYQLAVVTGLNTLFTKPVIDRFCVGQIEYRLNRAVLCAGSDQCFVCTFTQNEFERSDNDTFARTCFACNDREARCDSPFQLFHQSQIANPN